MLQLPTESTSDFHARLELLSLLIQKQIAIFNSVCKEVINLIFPLPLGPPDGFKLDDEFFNKDFCKEIGLDREVLRRMELEGKGEGEGEEEGGVIGKEWLRVVGSKLKVEVRDGEDVKVTV